MKKTALVFSTILFGTMMIQLVGLEKRKELPPPKPEITYTIEDTPMIPSVERIGINLGRWTQYGTAQFGNNVLQNPGLEGQIDRHLVIISQANDESFSDEAGWGYPNNEWNEAEFQVRTGKSAGKRGSITKSLNSGDNGFPQYFSHTALPSLEPNDIVILTKVRRPDPIDLWSTRYTQTTAIDPGTSRPKSEGTQSFKLSPTSTSKAELVYTLDTIAERAGKGLNVNGRWRFRIWAKGEKPNGELLVTFKRQQNPRSFFKTTMELTTEWQEYVIDFTGLDDGPPAPLQLSIVAFLPNNAVWLDDLYLGKLYKEEEPFREEVVSAIKELSPSFIREFPSTGDTWENRIALSHERKSWLRRYAGGRSEAVYSYSLPEFLSLCRQVKANPWIIVPPTLSNYECQKMGHFLADNAGDFSEIILEFGYENWNWLYRPTAIPYYRQHGTLADQQFDLISKAAGKKMNLTKFVNGQYTVPWESLQFLDMSETADGLAVAPYLLPSLNAATPDKQILKLLFQQDFSLLIDTASEVYARDKRLAIYEVNLDTTKGDARGYERNRTVTSAAAGSALAKQLLNFLSLGAQPVMVYNLAQYDTPTWEVDDLVNLWGIVRDFGPPVRFRPTGLAVKLLNEVIQGSMYPLRATDGNTTFDQDLTIRAFKGGDSWALAVVSESDQPRTIKVEFPLDGRKLPIVAHRLSFNSPFDNNEENENVLEEVQEVFYDQHSLIFTVPPYGLVVIGE